MQTNVQKSPITIIRLKEAMVRTGLPKSSFYEKIKNKEITQPVSIGFRRVGWPSYEIDEINRALISGANTQTIQKLVIQLTGDRQNLNGGL
jgi:predicted DNA-binding transcriptional regulator AlpA